MPLASDVQAVDASSNAHEPESKNEDPDVERSGECDTHSRQLELPYKDDKSAKRGLTELRSSFTHITASLLLLSEAY